MAANHTAVVTVAGAGPISVSAYTTLVASTPQAFCRAVIANNTDQNVALAIGSAGNEIDLVAVGKGCSVILDLSLNQIPVGSRLSVIAEGAATSSGYYTLSMVQ